MFDAEIGSEIELEGTERVGNTSAVPAPRWGATQAMIEAEIFMWVSLVAQCLPVNFNYDLLRFDGVLFRSEP